MNKRWIKALAGGLLLTVLTQFCAFAGVCGDLRQDTVRIHILAHSDSEQEQALKLNVRDAVIAAGTGLLDGVSSHKEAKQRIEDALPALQAAAQQCVWDNGYTHSVSVQTVNMYFSTRTYDGGILPAGYYDAVRFTVGDGAGKNWWCVLYPPLCVSAAVDTEGFTDAEQEVIQSGFMVKFKVVEWIEACLSWFKR